MKEELMSFTVIKDAHESLEDVDLPSKLSKKKKKEKTTAKFYHSICIVWH